MPLSIKELEEIEHALYQYKEWHFQPDPYPKDPDTENGLVFSRYAGAHSKTYSQPIFNVKKDHPDHGSSCHRCNPYSSWVHTSDQVIMVNHIRIPYDPARHDIDQWRNRDTEGYWWTIDYIYHDSAFSAEKSHP